MRTRERKAAKEESSIHKPQTNGLSPCLSDQARELMAPFRFLDVASFGFVIINVCKYGQAGLHWGSAICIGREHIWKHFILEEKNGLHSTRSDHFT